MDQLGFGDYSGPTKKDLKKDSEELAEVGDRGLMEGFRKKCLGMGGYRYGIVLSKVKENYLRFYPMKTLDSKE